MSKLTDNLTQKLLGYFIMSSCYGDCLIVDWLYNNLDIRDYISGDDEHPY